MTTTTSTAAFVYQQLRGHLTDLKLADAAEALPAVLDQAQAEGWTLTQALEQLLRVEVTATDARRLTGRFRFANLPPAPPWPTSTSTPRAASTGTCCKSSAPAATSTPPPTCC